MRYALSLILPGLGHIFAGFYGRAAIFLGATLLNGGVLGLAVARGRLVWLAQGVSARMYKSYWFSSVILVALLGLLWLGALWDLYRLGRRPEQVGQSYWNLVGRRFRKDPKGLLGAGIILVMLYLALFAPFFARDDPLKMDLYNVRSPPSAEHPFGTDHFGRDILDRVIYGSRTALGIGAVATLLNMVLGGVLGLLGGFYRGATDAVIMRFLEIINSIPFLLFALLAVSIFGSSIPILIIVLGIFGLQPARIIRSEVLSVREEDYILAAKALGVGTWRLIFRHVFPNAIASLLVTTTMSIGVNIIVVAGLSYLGFGVKPPTPDWGAMLGDAQEFFRTAWWMAVFPGLFIMITVFGFNILGDSLRDVMDPRLK
ncbi:MAG: Binding-protein-dependent transport systems inner membrane component [Acetothermia bacterium 64_32]|nr:MAG: Binding-protein-dependent transport systems inner membrane component [Acetothermia bacterium 64_32]HAF70942.1 ABC transporter permease [Candidatus Acetothermia bacterium]